MCCLWGAGRSVIGGGGNIHIFVFCTNNVVLSVFSQKCLGIYVDERLAFDAHIEDLCKIIVLVLVFLEELNPLFLKSVFLNYINP